MALHYTYTSPNNNLGAIGAAVRANLMTIGPTIMPALAGCGPETLKEACYAEFAAGTQFTGSPPTLHYASSYASPNAGLPQLAMTANANMQTSFLSCHPTLKLAEPNAPSDGSVGNTATIGQWQWVKVGLIAEVISGTSFASIPITPAFTYSLTGTSDAAYFATQTVANLNTLLGNANCPVPWAPIEVIMEAVICEILFGTAYTNV